MANVLIARQIPPPAAEMLRAAGHTVEESPIAEPFPRDILLQRVAGCAGVIATIGERIDAEFLAAAGPELKIVANFAVGYDNIDVAACRQRGVHVTNTPGVLTSATADLTWALILATARRVVEGDRLARSGGWHGWEPTQLLGLELEECVLGVIGAGRIGTAVGLRSAGFNMSLVYTNPRENPAMDRVGAKRVSLAELLPVADIVTIHVPMRPENRHMLSGPAFASMKPGALLINTARGPLIDEESLIAALQSGRIAGAGLDVYENEPRISPELMQMPNVVLLPHLGSATTKTRRRMSEIAARNVCVALAGCDPPNLIR